MQNKLNWWLLFAMLPFIAHAQTNPAATVYKRGIYTSSTELAKNSPSILIPFTIETKTDLPTPYTTYKLLSTDHKDMLWGTSVWGFSDGCDVYKSISGLSYLKTNQYRKLIVTGPYSLYVDIAEADHYYSLEPKSKYGLVVIDLAKNDCALLNTKKLMELVKPYADLTKQLFQQISDKKEDPIYFIKALNERKR